MNPTNLPMLFEGVADPGISWYALWGGNPFKRGGKCICLGSPFLLTPRESIVISSDYMGNLIAPVFLGIAILCISGMPDLGKYKLFGWGGIAPQAPRQNKN